MPAYKKQGREGRFPTIRIDRLLSQQGVCLRSEARAFLKKGGVTVDGVAVKDPSQKVDPLASGIRVNGKEITYREHVYIMMNKPKGVLSASRDPKQPTVLGLLPAELRRPGLFPAGRLDKDTEGFLIITDDGDFAHGILSPRKHVPKRYHAVLEKPADASDAKAFAEGIRLEDGTLCLPAVLEPAEEGAFVTISEGKYHQVKRMFEARGNKVLALKRLSVGGLSLDPALSAGQCREITPEELSLLKNKQ